MDLKKFDHIKIPDELDQYIDKGIAKGKAYNQSSFSFTKWKYKRFTKIVASITLIGSISLITIANVPVLANELEKIPVVGKLVKVLDFDNGSDSGGNITDGTKIGTQPISENKVDIFFELDKEVTDFVPYYNVTYREYPYGLAFEFYGVRGFDLKKQKKTCNHYRILQMCMS
ncbi:hypothetical protein [Bacillus sp. JJ722]|uniref:hypothetical protein n=1 Tax=Bacillus sp. JJ722 TaxID=3122973 RepID=UPI002FFE0E3F